MAIIIELRLHLGYQRFETRLEDEPRVGTPIRRSLVSRLLLDDFVSIKVEIHQGQKSAILVFDCQTSNEKLLQKSRKSKAR